MIQSKKDLEFYIQQDNKKYIGKKGSWKRWGGGNEGLPSLQ